MGKQRPLEDVPARGAGFPSGMSRVFYASNASFQRCGATTCPPSAQRQTDGAPASGRRIAVSPQASRVGTALPNPPVSRGTTTSKLSSR